MSNILGIGGIFFRAKNPATLKEWYINILGISIKDHIWLQETGPTVFEPFSTNSDYFAQDKSWMLNFRVRNLEDLISDLKSKGIEVIQKEEWNSMPGIGKFARIHDPEGNPIELWEPA